MAETQNEPWPAKALSHGEIQERLAFWRLELVVFKRMRAFGTLTRDQYRLSREIDASLDRWLDELSDLRGR